MEYDNENYLIPKVLLQDYEYNGLSLSAVITYSLLLDKLQKAYEKDWIDENGDVYLLIGQKELSRILGFSRTKISQIIQELEYFNLIERDGRKYDRRNLPYKTYVNEV